MTNLGRRVTYFRRGLQVTLPHSIKPFGEGGVLEVQPPCLHLPSVLDGGEDELRIN